MIRVVLPAHLRTLARVKGEVQLEVAGAVTLCAVVWMRYRKDDLSHVKRASWGEVGSTFLVALPAIALPFVIRAAVV